MVDSNKRTVIGGGMAPAFLNLLGNMKTRSSPMKREIRSSKT
jgi:hypothetical protein